MKNKGTMIINIDPYSLSESKLMDCDIQKMLKERFGMVSISYLKGEYIKSLKNRYTLIFDTRDHALEAAKWLNNVLPIGGRIE